MRRPLLVLSVATLLCGCGSSTADPVATAGAATAPPAAASAAPSVAAAVGAPTAAPTTGDLLTRCSDDLADAAALDLAGAVLVRQGDVLVTAFALGAPPAPQGGAFLTVELRSADGSTAHQLGVELLAGQPVAAYVAASPTAEPQVLTGTVHVEGAEVHAAFPAAVLDDLGEGWRWYAFTGTDATPVADTCPAAGTSGDDVPLVVVP
ncbi:hypothetical protein [Geodermatophilus sp. SYSU D00079]